MKISAIISTLALATSQASALQSNYELTLKTLFITAGADNQSVSDRKEAAIP
eukprot:Pgem_evm1s17128